MRIIGPFLFLAIAVGLYFSAIKPGWQVLQALNEQESRVDEVLLQANRLKDTYERLYTQRTAFSTNNMERLLVMVPDVVDPVRFVMQMDTIAMRHNITVENFSIPNNSGSGKASKTANVVVPLTFRFSVNGTYSNLKRFLAEIESSLMVMDVNSLSIVPIAYDEESGTSAAIRDNITMTFSVETHQFTGIKTL